MKTPISLCVITAMLVSALCGCRSKTNTNGSTTKEPSHAQVTVVTTAASLVATVLTSNTTGTTDAPIINTTLPPTVGGTTATSTVTQLSATTRVTTTTTTKVTTATLVDVKFPVTPAMPLSQRALQYNNELPANAAKTKIKSDCWVVADFDREWAFAHQPGLAWFKGNFYAAWASGIKDEDAPGQRAVVARSTDGGKTWSEPVVVGQPTLGELEVGLTCMMGGYFYSTDEKLYYYFTEYEYNPSQYDKNDNFIPGEYDLWKWQVYVVYTTDGVTWSEPEKVNGDCRFNESPRLSLTGRWMAGAGDRLGFADNPNGYDWRQRGLSSDQVADALNRGARMLTEASWYQTSDYVIHLMLRSNAGYVWMSESYDNGLTWTDAYRTNITSASTMINFGTLPDGRYYFVGSTTYDMRYPLELWVSDDGVNFDTCYILRDEIYRMQQDGWAKGGEFAYPEVLIRGNYMYVLYSKQKEVIELTRVALSDIK